MKKRQFLRKQNGVMLSDAIIAILIIILFAGTIITIMTNIVLEKTISKLNSQQLDYSVEILEYVDKLPYDNVNTDALVDYINNIDSEHISAGTSIEGLTTPYKVKVEVKNYNPEGEETTYDIIKIVTITIESKLGDKVYKNEVSRLKKRTPEEVSDMLDTLE